MHRTRLRAAALGAATAGAVALAAVPATAKGSLPTLTIALTKHSITVGGQMASGAVDVATTVRGEPMDNPTLIRLKPGVTPQVLGKFLSGLKQNSPLDGIDRYGTIVLSGQDAYKGVVTHTEVELPAGNYVVINDGNGHAIFSVRQSSAPATLPTPQATVATVEFGFRGATTLHDGELVRFKNDGFLVHMVQAAPVANAAAAAEAETYLREGDINAAKPLATGPLAMWSGPLSAGANQQYVLNAPPGIYVVFCSMNTQDGREHYQLGMEQTITVVK